MAEVFLAQQRGVEGWGRRVAVKRILPHLSDSADFNRMFLAEARLAARLSHPNIVHIYDFGKVADDYFIAMEFVDGIHAGNLIKLAETERLPAALIARIGADAAAALHYAHGQTDNSGKALGLVHRDVSPANLMVSFDGVVKLVDFGIAKAAALSEGKTSPGVIKGKYAYMSPEQTIGAPLDGRSDVFSLAVCMWEMLSGRVIVERGNAADAMRAIRDGRLARLDQVAPWVPPPLTRAITWAMENKREARCTAAEFGQALEEYIKASPDIATPLQLGSWLRTRFASTATGPMAAMPDLVAGPDTRGASVASPGTAVAPGTAAGAGVGAVDEPTGRGAQTILDPPRTLGGARSEPRRGRSAPEPVARRRASSRTPPSRAIAASADLAVRRPRRDRAHPDRRPRTERTGRRRRSRPRRGQRRRQGRAGRAPRRPGPGRAAVGAAARAGGRARRPARAGACRRADRAPAGRGRAGAANALGVAARDPGLAELADGEPTTAFLPSTLEHDETIDRAPHLRAAQAIGTVRLELPGSAAARQPTAPMAPPVAVADTREATVVAVAAGRAPGVAHATAPGPATVAGPCGPRRLRPSRPAEPVRVRRRSHQGRCPRCTRRPSSGRGRPPAPTSARWCWCSPGWRWRPPACGCCWRPAARVHPTTPGSSLAPARSTPARASSSPPHPWMRPRSRSAGVDAVGVDAAPARAVLEVITSPPGAEVQIGGARARAPAQFTVDPGIIELEIHLAGHVPAERRYEVAPGERRTVEIALRKASAGAPAASGRLTLRTDPYAEVYLGGRHLGQTPFAELVLPAGTHTLVLQHPGKKKVTRAVTIKPGQETRLFVRHPVSARCGIDGACGAPSPWPWSPPAPAPTPACWCGSPAIGRSGRARSGASTRSAWARPTTTRPAATTAR